MNQYRFYKTSIGKWFVDLPEWKGSIDELEMIMGTDTMLDMISEGGNEVIINISLTPFENCEILEKIEDTPGIGGALYVMKSYKGMDLNLKLWLCEVTRFVFGEIPSLVYLKSK